MRLLNTPIQIQTLHPAESSGPAADGYRKVLSRRTAPTEELCRYYAQQAEEGAVG